MQIPTQAKDDKLSGQNPKGTDVISTNSPKAILPS